MVSIYKMIFNLKNLKLLCKLPFYSRKIEKPKKDINTLHKLLFYGKKIEKLVKAINNIYLLCKLPFFNTIVIVKTDRAFKGYVESFQIDIANKTNLDKTFNACKVSLKESFSDLLHDKRGFKYVLTFKISLKKGIVDNHFKSATVYFNSLVKTLINNQYYLNESFQEMLDLLDVWLNESSGWATESIDSFSLNVSIIH